MTVGGAVPIFLRRKVGVWRCRVNPSVAALALAPDATAATPVEALIAERTPVPASRATLVCRARLVTAEGDLPVFVKCFRYRSAFDRVKHLCRPSRAQRAFTADQLLNREGFATPETLLTGWRQRGLLRDGFFTITAELTGYDNLYVHLARLTGTAPRRKRQLVEALAATVARMHHRGIAHGDLRLGNVLAQWVGDWRFAFLDNERTRQFASLPKSLRVKNLVQLNMLTGPTLTRSDRLRFFRAYCASGTDGFDPALLRQRVVARTRERWARLVAQGRLAPGDIRL